GFRAGESVLSRHRLEGERLRGSDLRGALRGERLERLRDLHGRETAASALRVHGGEERVGRRRRRCEEERRKKRDHGRAFGMVAKHTEPPLPYSNCYINTDIVPGCGLAEPPASRRRSSPWDSGRSSGGATSPSTCGRSARLHFSSASSERCATCSTRP